MRAVHKGLRIFSSAYTNWNAQHANYRVSVANKAPLDLSSDLLLPAIDHSAKKVTISARLNFDLFFLWFMPANATDKLLTRTRRNNSRPAFNVMHVFTPKKPIRVTHRPRIQFSNDTSFFQTYRPPFHRCWSRGSECPQLSRYLITGQVYRPVAFDSPADSFRWSDQIYIYQSYLYTLVITVLRNNRPTTKCKNTLVELVRAAFAFSGRTGCFFWDFLLYFYMPATFHRYWTLRVRYKVRIDEIDTNMHVCW